MTEPLIDECPNCESTDLVTADEVGDMWEDTDTACHNCKCVFDARGRQTGGFDSEVAEELHSTMLDALKQSLDPDSHQQSDGETR